MVGIKNIITGDTLCDEDLRHPPRAAVIPEPVISMSIEPKTKVDQEKMGIALQRLSAEDPTFRVFTDGETGQTIIAGMGELHLEIIRDRMFREFKVEADAGKPQIAYRETITSTPTARASSSGSRAAVANTATSSSSSSRTRKARASRSSTRSSAAPFRRNTSSRRRRASKRPPQRHRRPATR